MKRWRPILDGERAEKARQAIERIASEISDHIPEDPTLASGVGGPALFFAYHGLGFDCSASDARADQLTVRILQSDRLSTHDPGLYAGYTGCAWVIEHLLAEDEVATPEERSTHDGPVDPNQGIDRALLLHLRSGTGLRDYDLINGLSGLAVYALERSPRGSASAILAEIVRLLHESRETHNGMCAWHTPVTLLPSHQARRYPRGYYNLGVAHGIPGVIGVLAALNSEPHSVPAARPLLGEAVSWVLHQRLTSSSASSFPTAVADDHQPGASRLGWCYGDPGVAMALLAAAHATDNRTLEDIAIEIALRAAYRDPGAGSVWDAGLCHGAIGLAHMYNRMFQATGNEQLRAASLAWFDHGLAMWSPGEGIGGFSELHISPDGSGRAYRGTPGFLTGSSGIGLALIGATTVYEPEWDRLLLAGLRVVQPEAS